MDLYFKLAELFRSGITNTYRIREKLYQNTDHIADTLKQGVMVEYWYSARGNRGACNRLTTSIINQDYV